MTASATARLWAIADEVCRDTFSEPPRYTVSAWADAHRVLPSTSAEPGRFRTDRIPYMRRIMDVLGDETTRELVFVKGAQVGGSTVGENFVGYLIDQAPCGILEVWPTEKKLEAWSQTRLDPMLRETPALAAKFARKSGRREAGDSMSKKLFPGGWLMAITAKSTSDLKSSSARVAIGEEIDEWDGDVGGQGDPIALLRVRMRTFWNAKLYLVSTPTLEGASRIWRELEQSTWEEYWVPCPHCGEFQTLRWKDGDDDPDAAGAYRLVWDTIDIGGVAEVIPGSAKYVCAHCAATINERAKTAMLRRGEWCARFPGRRAVGFHISALYSPLCTWDDVAVAFLKSKGSDEERKTFVNTWLGLPYRERGESLNPHVLQERAGAVPYPADPATGDLLIPRGVGVLTLGGDVQGDRLEYVVLGWGARNQCWVIGWEQLDGDPGQRAVWDELDRVLLRPWKHEDGASLRIAAAGIDAGYMAETVWSWCEARRARGVFPLVGREGLGRPLLKAPDAKRKWRKSKKERRPMFLVGEESAKSILASRLRLVDPAADGYVHFPQDIDPVYFEHLTAEAIRTVYVRGRPVRRWVNPKKRANEGLDCTVYAMAALQHLGPTVIARLSQLAEQVTAQGRAITEGRAAPPAPRARRRTLSRGIE